MAHRCADKHSRCGFVNNALIQDIITLRKETEAWISVSKHPMCWIGEEGVLTAGTKIATTHQVK